MQECIGVSVGEGANEALREGRKEVNIAELVRNAYLEWQPKVVEVIPVVYPYPLVTPLITPNTRRGEWKFLRHHKKDRGFCAVYERKGKPQTMFSGESGHFPYVQDTAAMLSANILEQGILSWPLRALNTQDGALNMMMGMLIMYGVALTLPFLGYNEHLNEHLTKFPEYVDELMKTYPKEGALAVFVFGMAPFVSGWFGKQLGRIADRARIKNLPEEAYTYNYGYQSIDSLRGEYFILHPEKRC